MTKITYIGFSFQHHGVHSGYDYIRKVVPYSTILNCDLDNDLHQKFLAKDNKLTHFYSRFFGSRIWWVEFKYVLRALMNRNTIFHFIYPENIYRYFWLFKRKSNKIVCTFHQPVEFFIKQPKYLIGIKHVDKIIVLLKSAVEPMKKLSGNPNVCFIPHGVDTSFFSPEFGSKKERMVLMVGSWLRNFKFANEVFKQLLTIDVHAKVVIVCNPMNNDYFEAHDRLKVLNHISEEKLLQLFRKAKIIFLPLDSYCASNSILEGAACGCNVVVASNQSFEPDYLSYKMLEFIPLNIQSAVSKLQTLLDVLVNESDTVVQYEAIKSKYSWEKIGQLTFDMMQDLNIEK
jgi:glycosyltransferase involved in cell wall biosynthesis